MQVLTTATHAPATLGEGRALAVRPPARTPAPWTVSTPGAETPHAQGGLFDDLLGKAVPGLVGAASSLLGGDGGGALDQVRETGAAVVPGLVQQGATALGGLAGGGAGEAISSLGGLAGQGIGSVIGGQQSVGEAAGGLAQAAQPALLELLMSLLQR